MEGSALLILLGIAFLILEIFLPSFRALSIGGLIAVFVGSVFYSMLKQQIRLCRCLWFFLWWAVIGIFFWASVILLSRPSVASRVTRILILSRIIESLSSQQVKRAFMDKSKSWVRTWNFTSQRKFKNQRPRASAKSSGPNIECEKESMENTMEYLTAIVVISGIIMSSMIKILNEWERGVVLRLGKAVGVRGPGLIFLIPFCRTHDQNRHAYNRHGRTTSRCDHKN